MAPLDRPLRVLALANTAADPALGSGRIIGGYARELRSRGHEVRVLGPAELDPVRWVQRGRRVRLSLGAAWRLGRELARARWDVVELWGIEMARAARSLRRRPRRPLAVARSNGIEPHWWAAERGWNGLGGAYQPREDAFRATDALVTVSHFDARFAQARGYQPAGRILALENPLEEAWLTDPPPDTEERGWTVGYVGSWLTRKGCDRAQATFTALLAAEPRARVRLVGVGPGFPPPDFGPAARGRVEVVAFAAGVGALREEYGKIGVLYLPSRYESFGLVAAEALACGCALVATPTGLAADLVPGVEFERVDGGVDTSVAALLRLLREPARRTQRARAGRRRVASLRWGPAAEQLQAAYHRWRLEVAA